MKSTKHENVYNIVMQTLKVILISQICPICKYNWGKPSLLGGKDTRDTHWTGNIVCCRPNWDFSKRTNSKYINPAYQRENKENKPIKMIHLFYFIDYRLWACTMVISELSYVRSRFIILYKNLWNFNLLTILYENCHLIATYNPTNRNYFQTAFK